MLPAVEIVHDVVFFPPAPVEPRYLLRDAARRELFVAKVSITQHDNTDALQFHRIDILAGLRHGPSRAAGEKAAPA